MSSPAHTILWRRLDLTGHDFCCLWQTINGWQLSGTAMFLFNQMPCCLSYQVQTNVDWQTSIASVSGYMGESAVAFTITPTQDRKWSINGVDEPETAGCIDLDLGFTPATNLIAIRRLSLGIGERLQAPAAWLNFPDFQLKKLGQQYHRISDYQYEYISFDVDYSDILEVDSYGAITHYPALWEKEK
jgi:uncharacterized protein